MKLNFELYIKYIPLPNFSKSEIAINALVYIVYNTKGGPPPYANFVSRVFS